MTVRDRSIFLSDMLIAREGTHGAPRAFVSGRATRLARARTRSSRWVREAVGDDRPRERSRLGLAAVRGARRSARGSARDTSGVAREVNARARPRRASDASDASARGRPNSSPERVEWV